MELAITLTEQDKRDIAQYTAEIVLTAMNGKPKEDKVLNTQEAMEYLGYKDHEAFRRYVKDMGINGKRGARHRKYYKQSELKKTAII